MLEPSKPLHLLEVFVADAVSKEIQTMRDEICCGCKVYNQDCLMTTDHEAWDIHGLNALDRISQQTLVWNKFIDVMKILDMEICSDLKDYLAWLQTDSDPDFERELLQLHENNNEVIYTIDNILNFPEQPVEPYVQCFFSYPPSYKYYIKKSEETFKSNEGNARKAYQKYMKSKLRYQINKMF